MLTHSDLDMFDKMRTTTDTYTGKRFRYNQTVLYYGQDDSEVITVGRMTSRGFTFLHPDRLTPVMFAKLNPQEH